MLRVRGYFATVYAVGCLAIRFKILPFTEAELLAAILSCHRDHVAFVDNEVAGGPSWTADAVRAQEVVDVASARKPIAGAVVPATTPFDRLRRYINRNHRRGFIDLRSPRFGKLFFKLGIRRSKGAPVLGYVARRGILPSLRAVRASRRRGPRSSGPEAGPPPAGNPGDGPAGQRAQFCRQASLAGWHPAVLRRHSAPPAEVTGARSGAHGGGASVVGTNRRRASLADPAAVARHPRPTRPPDGGSRCRSDANVSRGWSALVPLKIGPLLRSCCGVSTTQVLSTRAPRCQ